MVMASCMVNFNNQFYLLGNGDVVLESLKEGLYYGYSYVMTTLGILDVSNFNPGELCDVLVKSSNLKYLSLISIVMCLVGGQYCKIKGG